MSIILNALRKSEQERQLHQSLDVNSSTQSLNELKRSNTPYWIIVLIVVNLFFLSYFVWIFTTDQQSVEKETKQMTLKKPNHEEVNIIAAPENVVIKSVRIKDQQQAISKQPIKPKYVQNEPRLEQWNHRKKESQSLLKLEAITPVKKADIADIIKKQKSAVVKSTKNHKPPLSIVGQMNKRPSKPKMQINKQDVVSIERVKKKRQKVELVQPSFEDRKQATTDSKIVTIKTEVTKKTNHKNKIPWLSELSYEFRRSVPDIKINVYVFTENKKDRFIMVNMIKHVEGHDLGEGMILKEIGMNSFIVEYKNRVFKINRN